MRAQARRDEALLDFDHHRARANVLSLAANEGGWFCGTCRVFVLPGHPTHSTGQEKKLQAHYVWMKALKFGRAASSILPKAPEEPAPPSAAAPE